MFKCLIEKQKQRPLDREAEEWDPEAGSLSRCPGVSLFIDQILVSQGVAQLPQLPATAWFQHLVMMSTVWGIA
jgi:hypothetical protein